MAFLQSPSLGFRRDALFKNKKIKNKNPPSGIKNSLNFTALTCGLFLRVGSSGGQRAARFFLRHFSRINELPFSYIDTKKKKQKKKPTPNVTFDETVKLLASTYWDERGGGGLQQIHLAPNVSG